MYEGILYEIYECKYLFCIFESFPYNYTMIITPLWHTEFLIDISNTALENVRILVDTWLSDVVVGDLMERSTLVALDTQKLSTIDMIYISHSHTDHLDPYTILEIYKHANPLLILPNTLAYLAPVFREYIDGIQIEFLIPKKPFRFRWIEITGYMFSQLDITNEDDVMMLAINNETELIFAEIDTVPDEYDQEVQSELFQIFDRKNYQTRAYLASRNELEWQLRIYDLDAKRRKSFRSEYIAGRKDEIRASYEKFEYDEYTDLPNIFTLPGFVRGFIGQWLQYPASLSFSLSELAIFPLEEIASMEGDIARSFGYDFSQKAILPGRQYRIENGLIEAGRKECPIANSIQSRVPKYKNPEENRIYAKWPLIPRDVALLDRSATTIRLLDILNHRFLPYWSASPVASLRSALMSTTDGAYRIAFKTNTTETILFEYSFASSIFSEVSPSWNTRIDESYWIQDILDFLSGKQELYSNFWHQLESKKIYRLWMCLGANFMNQDLVLAKYRFHFERANRGESVVQFVESIILWLGK